MRLQSFSSLPLASAVLLLGCLPGDALARPAPEPKAAWVRQGRGRKGLMKSLMQRSVEQSVSWNSTTGPNGPPGGLPACPDNAAAAITAPKTNVWGGLTDEEAAGVVSWLFAQEELNLTVSEDAGPWDNSLLLVELQAPNKTDVVKYFDSNGTAPARYAHAVLDHRASDEPYYQDILVGPLPVVNGTTTWEPLEYPYTRKTEGKIRNLDADGDDALYDDWIYPISASVADITLDLWNGTALGLDNDTIDIWGIDPLWQEGGRIKRWDSFWNYPVDQFDAETLLPLGLFFKSDVTGRDPSQWKLEGWLYNDVFYATTEEFRAAYWSEGFEKLGANVEGDWARTDHQGDTLPFDTSYPPISVAPSGSRYAVDSEAKYVEWMDFSFYLSFSRDTGLAVHDIKYKGERILYELGLQEALAHYAGNDPVQSGTSYLDTYYGFGPYAFELLKGYDCPAYATYLNTSFYVSETTHTHLNSLCLFEYDSDYPIQRHSNSEYVTNTKNIYFTVRSVSTVGNYDYMFSYSFYLDGSIGVEVRASGYIQSAYYAHNEDFGYQVNEFLSGSMHDHVLNFKADFDILGTENTVQLTTNVPVTRTFSWSNDTRNTMQLQRSIIESEDDSRINWDGNGVTQVRVINMDESKKNKYGEYRGYRILPSTGTAHLTVLNSSNVVNAAHWAEYDLQFTKQHDYEPRAAHAYSSQDVADPPVNFNEFFNGENLTQTDLVLWFNLGMHHVPHTGDLPNTVFTTAHSGVQFMPLNYFLMDASRQTVNMVRIDYSNGTVETVETFGQKDESCMLDFEPVEVDLWDYHGDVVVRKFPYDPNDPYYETDSIV